MAAMRSAFERFSPNGKKEDRDRAATMFRSRPRDSRTIKRPPQRVRRLAVRKRALSAAVPDPFALLILIGTIAATLALRVGAFKVVIGGAVLGVLRSQLPISLLTRHF